MERGGSPHTEHPPPPSAVHLTASLFLSIYLSLFPPSAVLSFSPQQHASTRSVVIYSAAVLMSMVQRGHVQSLRVAALQGHRLFVLPPLFRTRGVAEGEI